MKSPKSEQPGPPAVFALLLSGAAVGLSVHCTDPQFVKGLKGRFTFQAASPPSRSPQLSIKEFFLLITAGGAADWAAGRRGGQSVQPRSYWSALVRLDQ